jgi:uncharacterized iron-regulated protein
MTTMQNTTNQPGWRRLAAGLALVAATALHGCALKESSVQVDGPAQAFAAGQIVSAAERGPVAFEEMLSDLRSVRVVYVGETHNDPAHHAVQLQVIEALNDIHPDLAIGMEMFDHTYQEVLDRWTAGGMSEEAFVKQTHWYANWRWDFALYRDILLFARDAGIRLVALNIPFHIPPKIAAGGLESLGPTERAHLPRHIDTANPEHRAYVEKIFKRHPMRGERDFESFYEAQCAWEDAMAERVADASGQVPMVVLAGNGHIRRKFGIPDRAYARNGAPFRTVYPLSAGTQASPDLDLDLADYLWITF